MGSPKKASWYSWIVFGLILAAAYFGNVELQTYLGRQALAEVKLDTQPLNQALAMAKTQDKLVLADMSAIWCGTCRKLDQEVFADDQVKTAIERDYVFSRIEYESPEGKAFAERYQVRGLPTVLVLDARGEIVQHLPLTFDPQSFINLIEQVAHSG